MNEKNNDLHTVAENIIISTSEDINEQIKFDAPWQVRAFAISIILSKQDIYDWDRFSDEFTTSLKSTNKEVYQDKINLYKLWLGIIEDIVIGSDLIDEYELEKRQAEFESGDRDASEFYIKSIKSSNLNELLKSSRK